MVADSPASLKDMGNAALNVGDNARAARMYTLGLDLTLSAKPNEVLSAADWFKLEDESNGVLSALLSNRSLAYLQQGDSSAAAIDAEHCCLARPTWVKGHLRLLAALETGGAQMDERLAAAERGLRACPSSAQLKEAKAALTQAAAVDEHSQAHAPLLAALPLISLRPLARARVHQRPWCSGVRAPQRGRGGRPAGRDPPGG